jgi:hypothetical protein
MKNVPYTVVDDLLPREELTKIRNILLCADFPWYLTTSIDFATGHDEEPDDYLNNFQFVHAFLLNNTICSEYYFPKLFPILNIIKPDKLIRIKANLSTVSSERVEHAFHVDTDAISTTSIFYVNTNDGVTILEDGTEIKSVANRLLTFDSHIKHKGTTCTNEKVRCLINLNYVKNSIN